MAGIEAQGELQKAMAMYGPETEALSLETASRNALIGAFNRDAATQYQAGAIRRRGRTCGGAGEKRERDRRHERALS